VLAAFGASAAALVPLPGGRGTAWRAGDVVLKPLDLSPDELRWQADVLSSATFEGVRVAVPLRSRAGDLAVDGWSAWPALAGRHEPRWEEIATAGERFHRALAGVGRPSALLDARTDPWALADRVAWGEATAGARAGLPAVARLLALRRPVRAASQLVHGDLSGNVLLAPGLPPAVIDFAPYWRPAAYASAVVAVDAVAWHGAGLELLSRQAARGGGVQLLVRALLFRILAEEDAGAAAAAYGPALAHVARL
jgi:uncharacterized protein (TIGR02569 family)